jgi:peptidoglycan hydrolase CwlO-like protein
MSNYKTEYQYNEHSGNSYFYIEYNGLSMCGQSKCHPDDADMMSERTGLTIAEARAHIQMLKAKKKYEIQPKIDVLRHLLTNIQSSKNHNPKAYESCMLRSQLAHWEGQLAEINADIADEEKYLKEYIDQKDKLYRKLRARNQ